MSKKGDAIASTRLLRRWQRNLIIVATVLVVFIAAVGGVVVWMFGGDNFIKADDYIMSINLTEENGYYLGDEGDANMQVRFPGYDVLWESNVMTSLPAGTEGEIVVKHKQDGTEFTLPIINVENAINLSFEDEILEALKVEENKKNIVIHNTEIETTERWNLYTSLYGNAVNINVHEVVKGNATDGVGEVGINIPVDQIESDEDNRLIVRDVHVFGKVYDPITDEAKGLRTYSYYGPILQMSAPANTKTKGYVEINNSIFEKGGKVVHVERATDVVLDNVIMKDASDTALSVGTFNDGGSTITIRNDVIISNSLTGGVVFYCYDNINKATEAAAANKLYIEKKADLQIYNWKDQNGLAFMPDSEGAELASIANTVAGSTITNKQYDNMKVEYNDSKYLHFGIILIRSSAGGDNKSTVEFEKDAGFSNDTFPVPSLASAILKQLHIWSYFNNNTGSVPVEADLLDNKIFQGDGARFSIKSPALEAAQGGGNATGK